MNNKVLHQVLRCFLLISLFAVYNGKVYAQLDQFLVSIINDSDTRSLALGRANAADPVNPSISFLNPASFSLTNRKSLSYASYHSWERNIYTSEIAFRAKQHYGHGFALNFQFLDSGFNQVNYLGNAEFTEPDIQSMQLTLGYSYATSSVFSIGILGRGYTAWNDEKATERANFDFGLLYAPTQMLSYSLVFRNLGFGLEYEILGNGNTKFRNINLNESVEYGSSFYFPNQSERWVVSIHGAAESYLDKNNTIIRAGVEVKPISPISIRGGYFDGDDELGFSFGIGADLSFFSLSYSVLADSRTIDRSHQLELLINF